MPATDAPANRNRRTTSADRIEDLEEDLGGDGGVRERLTRVEAAVHAHGVALSVHEGTDAARHAEVIAWMSGNRTMMLALIGIVALVVIMLGAIVGVRTVLDDGAGHHVDVSAAAP
jgi:hypothetical protein